MYILKEIPEDFIVKERVNYTYLETGDYSYFLLKKKQKGMYEVLEKLGRDLKLPQKKIGFAGAKDKEACTEQIISIPTERKRIAEYFSTNGITLEFLGYQNRPVSLGRLEGNDFIITVRNIENKPHLITQTINYFDEQRFSKVNAKVGKYFVQKKLKEACELIDDTRVSKSLEKKPTDFVGALKTLPLKVLTFYVHAYQSYLWNEIVAKYIKTKSEKYNEQEYSLGTLIFPLKKVINISIPLVGFGTDYDNEEIEQLYKDLLKKEGIQERDFIMQNIPYLSAEGGNRNLIIEISKMTLKVEEDELHKGKKKCIVTFSLPKGSYATMVIKSLFL